MRLLLAVLAVPVIVVLVVLALGLCWPLHGLEMRVEGWLAGWPWQRWRGRRELLKREGW